MVAALPFKGRWRSTPLGHPAFFVTCRHAAAEEQVLEPVSHHVEHLFSHLPDGMELALKDSELYRAASCLTYA